MYSQQAKLSKTNPETNLRKEIAPIISNALPIMGFTALNISINIILGIMLKNIGPRALAAGAIIIPVQAFLFMFFGSTLFSISALVARKKGKYNRAQSVILSGAILLGVFLSLIASSTSYLVPKVLYWFNFPESLLLPAQNYFHSLVWGMPLAIFLTIMQQMLLGLKKNHIVFLSGLVGFFAFALTVIFLLNQSKLEINTATLAWAQNLRLLVSLLFLSIICTRSKILNFPLNFKNKSKKYFLFSKKIFSLGLPISINAASDLIAAIIFVVFISWLGTEKMMMQHIAAQCALIMSIPIMGLSQSIKITVGEKIGNAPASNILSNISYVCILCILITLALIVLFFSLSSFVAQLYLEPELVRALSIKSFSLFFTIYFSAKAAEFLKIIYSFALRSLYETKYTSYINTLTTWALSIPLAFFLSKTRLSICGIVVAQFIGLSLSAFLLKRRISQRLKAS